MRAVKSNAPAGFTLVEAVAVVAVLGVLLAVGVPNMSKWLLARKAVAVAGFYQDGFTLARSQAIAHNSASRLVLVDNTGGQKHWRVDICYPTGSASCNASGAWSTETAVATNDPDQTDGYKSVLRSASTLPATSAVAVTTTPATAAAVYFTPMGWVDGTMSPNLSRIDVAPSSTRPGTFVPMRVALTLGGGVSICNPALPQTSPKRCP